MFYGGKMKGMPPKLMSDDGKHIVIRPLAYCREKDIQRFADAKAFPIIPCNLCGSQPNLQRQVIADMLRDWDKRYRAYRDDVQRNAECGAVASVRYQPVRFQRHYPRF